MQESLIGSGRSELILVLKQSNTCSHCLGKGEKCIRCTLVYDTADNFVAQPLY